MRMICAQTQDPQTGAITRAICPVLCGICPTQSTSSPSTTALSAVDARDALFTQLDGDGDGEVTSSDVDAFCSESPGDGGTKCNTTEFMAVLNISIDGSMSKVQFDAAVAQTGGMSEIGLGLAPAATESGIDTAKGFGTQGNVHACPLTFHAACCKLCVCARMCVCARKRQPDGMRHGPFLFKPQGVEI